MTKVYLRVQQLSLHTSVIICVLAVHIPVGSHLAVGCCTVSMQVVVAVGMHVVIGTQVVVGKRLVVHKDAQTTSSSLPE